MAATVYGVFSATVLLRHTFKILVQSFSWWESEPAASSPISRGLRTVRFTVKTVYTSCSFVSSPVQSWLVWLWNPWVQQTVLSAVHNWLPPNPHPSLGGEQFAHLGLIDRACLWKESDWCPFLRAFPGWTPVRLVANYVIITIHLYSFPASQPLLHGPELAFAGLCEIEHTDLPKRPFFLGSPLLWWWVRDWCAVFVLIFSIKSDGVLS